jgi:acetyltransferase
MDQEPDEKASGIDGFHATMTLPNGTELRFRPVRPDDEAAIADSIRTASRETMMHRFFTPLRGLPPDQLRRMITIDPAMEACLVGELDENGRHRVVCGARYVRLADRATAEIAVTVHDDFQQLGIGAALLRHLTALARADGIRSFVADVLPSNTGMLRLLRNVLPQHHKFIQAGVYHVECELNPPDTERD